MNCMAERCHDGRPVLDGDCRNRWQKFGLWPAIFCRGCGRKRHRQLFMMGKSPFRVPDGAQLFSLAVTSVTRETGGFHRRGLGLKIIGNKPPRFIVRAVETLSYASGEAQRSQNRSEVNATRTAGASSTRVAGDRPDGDDHSFRKNKEIHRWIRDIVRSGHGPHFGSHLG